jgi:hypothetical protein
VRSTKMDVKDRSADRRDLRHDVKSGDSTEVRRDRRELMGDRLDVLQDKRGIFADKRDVRQDRRAIRDSVTP